DYYCQVWDSSRKYWVF
nr:immunoglobulin light chain junction region [Macaca mulatta]MOY15132.1 immunoglobulin light chain junction region [Macaca mulatta]MOY15194.1 immunoglobulin light chain junction region [Macaca mulatta]MOY15551.1 immunoglobulin light chain junction region [Macaca mulatta]MOY15867.1 immunoglobulin light chain junction region [Macaca mulatta]